MVYYSDRRTRDFDVMLLMGQFDNSQRAALRALIAFSCILLLAAAIALASTAIRSWLSRNSRRDKTRLSLFIICLISIIGARAISVSELVDNLNGPQSGARYSYYDSYSFLVRHVFNGLLSLVAEIFLFVLVLLEVTRSHGATNQKHSTFEWANLAFILVLLAFLMTSFGIDARYVMGPWNEDYGWEESWAALPGIQTTYATLAIIFATEMLFISFRKSFPKAQQILLIVLSVALWLGQVLDLSKTTLRFFSPVLSAYTKFWAISCVVEVLWAVKLLALALLARHSANYVLNGGLSGHQTRIEAKF